MDGAAAQMVAGQTQARLSLAAETASTAAQILEHFAHDLPTVARI